MDTTSPAQLSVTVGDVLTEIQDYLPNLLGGLVVVVVGLFVAWVCSKVMVRLLILSRVDRVIVRLGWSRALEKGDVRHSLFAMVGMVLGTIVFLGFLENAVVIWRLTVLSSMIGRLVDIAPRLLIAGVVLLIGWGVALGVSRAVQRALHQEGFSRARLAGRAVYAGLVAIAGGIALAQLQVAPVIVNGAFLLFFGALALAAVLAFGLGSRRAVERMWEDRGAKKESANEPPKP